MLQNQKGVEGRISKQLKYSYCSLISLLPLRWNSNHCTMNIDNKALIYSRGKDAEQSTYHLTHIKTSGLPLAVALEPENIYVDRIVYGWLGWPSSRGLDLFVKLSCIYSFKNSVNIRCLSVLISNSTLFDGFSTNVDVSQFEVKNINNPLSLIIRYDL